MDELKASHLRPVDRHHPPLKASGATWVTVPLCVCLRPAATRDALWSRTWRTRRGNVWIRVQWNVAKLFVWYSVVQFRSDSRFVCLRSGSRHGYEPSHLIWSIWIWSEPTMDLNTTIRVALRWQGVWLYIKTLPYGLLWGCKVYGSIKSHTPLPSQNLTIWR